MCVFQTLLLVVARKCIMLIESTLMELDMKSWVNNAGPEEVHCHSYNIVGNYCKESLWLNSNSLPAAHS